jgi:DNA-binding IclR family transcriptional regulator
MGTAQRITNTLIHLQYLSNDPKTKTFHLTSKWLRIGFSVLNDLNLHKLAYPYLKELNEETNETVTLGVIDDNEVIIIERFETKHFITPNISPGVRRPIHINSIGRAILAFQNEDKIKEIINRIEFVKYTDKTIVDIDKFYDELKKIRKNSYSINDGEVDRDLFAIGVPILNNNNEAIAGISLVIPKARLSKSKVYKKYLPSIIEKGKLISKQIGGA